MKETCPHLACLESTGKHGGKSWTSELCNHLCIYYLGPGHEGQAACVRTPSLSPLLSDQVCDISNEHVSCLNALPLTETTLEL